MVDGGVGAEKAIGVLGRLLAPEVCTVIGASGAAVLMTNTRSSKLVAAINHDANIVASSQADTGVVDDWKTMLEVLVTSIHADCQ